VADQTGRKADLDNEGIVFADTDKAELDKDGIPLESREAMTGGENEDGTPSEPENDGKPKSRKRLIVLAAGGGACLLVLTIVTSVFFLGSHGETPTQSSRPVNQNKEAVFGADGMTLDPFMVFYETRVPNKSGVLIAQVSLKVDPAVIPTIQGKLYDIRRIIYRRLSAAASVYSQTEISLMLSDDLMDYPIKEVAFVQFSSR
jgi:flagellar basal body-associated protein FliL